MVNANKTQFDQAFIDGQRARLNKLREDLLNMTQGARDEQAEINANSNDESRESEDDAQRLAMLELDDNLVARNAQRLASVQRALQKIDEGSYGLSDASGEPIPRDRLQAVPDAIYTIAEQDARDKA